MTNINDRLVLVITASYQGAVGFGEIFNCEIRRVITGIIEESNIRLSVLAGDKDKLKFISEHLHPAQLEIGFTINREDESYSIAPISGFVDKSKTSWEIDFIHKVKE